ncbi:hypothetical protein [endosymbiont GvMRE of Glomus versiforme]|uniref:hypothetical protein n=1 Tax=endosymbiont GvMRE of Glomus versiforme TaxID=2039283 RepID=UPI000EE6D8FD|nr:hypothetical protein [endosymbiont GvMRE of Glomus versiforme]RHZ36693.1 hypothetical protein GvMRE_I2g376 [endosymbiont GvMRE of Glomus versiforme]
MKKMGANKEFVFDNFQSLLSECKSLRKKLGSANYSERIKFHKWMEKRQKLEITEDDCYEVELEYFDKKCLKQVIQIICNELLKLISPRKRKHAQKLICDFRLPSEKLSWERLNSVSSSQSLPIEGKNLCATCAKKISWWSFVSKNIDEQGNQFCSHSCREEFHHLICDKCNVKIFDTPYYINKEEREGIVCFDCASTKCLGCHKTILHSSDYFQKLLLGLEREKTRSSHSENYFPFCKSCQTKKISQTEEEE